MYPVEIKARAAVLFQDGYSAERIQRELGDDAPSVSTLYDWRNELQLSGVIRTQSEELAIRAGKLLHRAIDGMSQLPDEQLVKHAQTLNIIRGTNQDKLDRQPLIASQNTYVFMQAQLTEPAEPKHAASELPSSRSGMGAHTGMELEATFRPIKDAELDTGADSGALQGDPSR